MFRAVVSLHGIRTRGVWQKDLVPVLARRGFVPYALDYGSFSLRKLASPGTRDRQVEWLRAEYERVVAEERVQRPSVIAHSFGTYLVAKVLEKYPELRFDKIIFAGSIVRRDFDWPARIEAGQVNFVRNDYGGLDDWPRLARYLVPDTGPSGASPFTASHPLLLQHHFPKHRHSDYFHRTHFTNYWIPTLMRMVVSPGERVRFTNLLDMTCQAVAAQLGMLPGLVRANVFVPDERGLLRIPEGLVHNMPGGTERTVTIEPGSGCSGISFQEGRQTIALLHTDWGRHTLPQSELAKVDPRVRWIVSTPIPDPDLPGGRLGVVSVDGLDAAKTKEELSPLLRDLAGCAATLGLTFKEIA